MKILPLILLLLLVSCSRPDIEIEGEDATMCIIKNFAAEQRRKQHLNLMSTNTTPDKTSVHLRSARKIKLEEARTLYIKTLSCFIEQSSLPIEKLDFTISFADNYAEFYDPPYIAYIHLKKDKVVYCYYDHFFGKFTDYKDVEEPYVSAKE